MWAKVIIILFATRFTEPFVAYDCTTTSANATVISLRDVQDCPDRVDDFTVEHRNIQVIQQETVQKQYVRACLIEVTRTIFYCGMHSHSSIVSGGLSEYVLAIGAEECYNAHQYQTIKIYGQILSRLTRNGTSTASVTLFGTVDNNGKCQGVSYHENGQTWNDVIVLASIKVSLQDYWANVKSNENEISLLGGITCPYLPGYCMDTTYGESTWKREPHTNCLSNIVILFQGNATFLTTPNKERYVVVEDEGKVFALTLVNKVQLCHHEAIQTEHPLLVVLDLTHQRAIPDEDPINSENVNLMSYVNSKFLYIEQAYRRAVNDLYIDTIRRRCDLQREILKAKLITAAMAPHEVGWLIKQKRGYIGRVLGEVLYLVQCVPRPVSMRRTQECYNELPITVSNSSKFMAPLTHMIQDYAEQIDCTSLTPPLYYIENQWIGFSPTPIDGRTPTLLAPEIETKQNFTPLAAVSKGGLYTNEEVEKSQQLLTFGIQRKVVQNILTTKLSGTPTQAQGFKFIDLLEQEELHTIVHSSLEHLWGFLVKVGIFCNGIMGIYFLYQITRFLFTTIVNGWRLYGIFGFSYKLLASICSTLTYWLAYDHQKQQEKPQSEQREEVPIYANPIPRVTRLLKEEERE